MSQGDFESHERAPAGPRDDSVAGGARLEDDAHWMGLALEQALLAREKDEVPIGAVVVLERQVIGRGHNQTRGGMDPTAHAEMVAIAAAARTVQAQRLVGATVYTTVEPCFMCAGALLHARVARVVWGVRDPKFGGCVSLGNLLGDPRLNHRAQITEGVRADEARALLQTFFREKRAAPPRAE
ncbi:MAG: tRNA adenosine(34) deaminase TadA [Planctomycetota bacterium]